VNLETLAGNRVYEVAQKPLNPRRKVGGD
jgi:hypothetical protein